VNKDRLQILLEKYFNNTINSRDCGELLKYIEQADPELFSEMIDRLVRDKEDGPVFKEIQANKVYDFIKSDPRFKVSPHKLYHKGWFRIAAVLIISLSLTCYLVNTKKAGFSSAGRIADVNTKDIVVPGGNKAILTLSTGKKIVLGQAGAGQLAKESGVEIEKTKKGEIIYKALSDVARSGAAVFNTIETPRGGEYQVILPDGTRVWLNAASSLSYPTVFNSHTRDVRLTGEAYFEVAKNKNMPFHVHVNGSTIQVLGTSFNITSYADENDLTATLLIGSVRVLKNGHQALLQPGQQAVIDRFSGQIVISSADISEVMAWKNGYFLFRDEDIKSIMKKIARWYDIEVEYRGDVEGQKFGGTFYRSKSFKELLHYLEKLGSLHFKIEGRRIIVMT